MYSIRKIEETKYGRMLYNKDIEAQLITYLSMVSKDTLKYGLDSPNYLQFVFITGKNDAERAIPIFDIPYIIEKDKLGATSNSALIVTDVRGFMSPKVYGKEEFDLLSESNNLSELNLRILRSMIYSDFFCGEAGCYLRFMNTITDTYNLVIMKMFRNMTVMDMEETLKLEMLIHYYVRLLGAKADSIETVKDMTIYRLESHRRFEGIPSNTIREFVENCPMENATLENLATTIGSYVFKEGSEMNMTLTKSQDPLYNQISRLYSGYNAGKMAMVGFEHYPTWMSLITVIGGSKSFKAFSSSTLSKLLDDRNIKSEINKFRNDLNTVIQERFSLVQ